MDCKTRFCVILSLCIFIITKTDTSTDQCIFRRKTSFDQCGSKAAEEQRYTDREINQYNPWLTNNQNECNETTPCRRLFRTGRIRSLSFGAKISVHVSEALHHCCGECTKYQQINLTPPLTEVPMSVIDQLDIIYPVYSQPNNAEVHGLHFVSVLNIPKAYYFTLRNTKADSSTAFLDPISSSWPLLIICLSMCFIAGFLVWLLETWSNEEEFPRSFAGGLREGFWWSFVSMTTVGYGDKCPRSLMGRMVAVGWIVFGITINSIYVSELTSGIMEARKAEEPAVDGARVGVLKNRLYDSVMILQHGGILKEMPYNNTVVGVVQMIHELKNGTIDGFLITKPTFYYFSREIQTEKYQYLNETIEHVYNSLRRSSLDFVDEKLVAGILVRNDTDYRFLKRYFENNWLQIQGCYAADLSYKHKKFGHERKNAMTTLFVPLFTTLLYALFMIGCFGIFYEVIRRRTIHLLRDVMKKNEEDGGNEKKIGLCEDTA